MLIKQNTEMTEQERIAVQNSNNRFLQSMSYVAVGTIYPFAGNNIPETFMLCDGSSLDITEYAELFEVIGYSFGGSGDKFCLPNLKGRTIVGADVSESDFNTVGKSGGSKEVTLTVEQMPRHSHRDGTATQEQNGGINAPVDGGASAVVYWDASSGRETTSVGGDKAHENMPPYLVINYIIKVTNAISKNDFRFPIENEYNPKSENAQSGIAVAAAIAGIFGGDSSVTNGLSPILQKKLELWQPNTEYKVGDVVVAKLFMHFDYVTNILVCKKDHTSSDALREDTTEMSEYWEFNPIVSNLSMTAVADYFGNPISDTYATKAQIGDIETALDSILDIENSFIGLPVAEEAAF